MLTFVLYAAGFYLLVILAQSLFIFPGAFFSLLNSKKRDSGTLPPDVESIFISTRDGKSLEVWRLPVLPDQPEKPYIGIVFHGNGGSLENFLLTQLWFQEMGIVSYGFDYRGYGKSSGWPGESGISIDGDAVWEYVTKRENIDAGRIIILGVSVGGAPAARIASIHNPKVLLLISSFTSLRDVVKDQMSTFVFAPFVWFKFSTIEYVKLLKSTHLILASSTRDTIVKPYHSALLAEAYCGSLPVQHLTCSESGHNGVFYSLRRELAQAVLKAMANTGGKSGSV